MIHFDHFEIHVTNSKKYTKFLQLLFQGGRFKKISKNNTYMFLSPDGIHIEVKENKLFNNNFNIESGRGLCLACLRMKNAGKHLKNISGIKITNILHNPDGKCFFFKDYENIDWHIKGYETQDIFVNI